MGLFNSVARALGSLRALSDAELRDQYEALRLEYLACPDVDKGDETLRHAAPLRRRDDSPCKPGLRARKSGCKDQAPGAWLAPTQRRLVGNVACRFWDDVTRATSCDHCGVDKSSSMDTRPWWAIGGPRVSRDEVRPGDTVTIVLSWGDGQSADVTGVVYRDSRERVEGRNLTVAGITLWTKRGGWASSGGYGDKQIEFRAASRGFDPPSIPGMFRTDSWSDLAPGDLAVCATFANWRDQLWWGTVWTNPFDPGLGVGEFKLRAKFRYGFTHRSPA